MFCFPCPDYATDYNTNPSGEHPFYRTDFSFISHTRGATCGIIRLVMGRYEGTSEGAAWRVAFLGNMDHKSMREHYAGALRFAAESRRYEIKVLDPHACSEDVARQLLDLRRPDAMIVCNPFQSFAAKEFPRLMPKIPVVVLNQLFPADRRRGGRCDARVIPNEELLVGRVAGHFVSRGFANFAYLGMDGYPRSKLREKIFQRALKEAGFRADVFRIPWANGYDDASRDGEMRLWLASLPKPCAMLIYWDYLSQKALALCRKLDIAVPEQLSIISVDNVEEICETTVPALSSIEPDFRAGGYQAMKCIDKLMRGERRTPSPPPVFRYGVRRFVERTSSQDVRGAARIVVAAQGYIRLHATEGLCSQEVARTLNISQRLLEGHFSTVLGRTPHEEIQLTRLAKVKELLQTTNLPLEIVAERAGYSTLHHLQNLFKARFGVSLRTWRATWRERC